MNPPILKRKLFNLYLLLLFAFLSSSNPLANDGAIPVVATNYNEITPVFSWDSQKIAYISDSSGTYQIYVADKYGRFREQITFVYEICWPGSNFANWSHDGQYITYILSNPYPYRDLYIVDVSTKEDTNLTLGYGLGEVRPVFSPDDSLILFDADPNYNGWFDVYTICPKTLSLFWGGGDGYLYAWSSWSHSGGKIAYRNFLGGASAPTDIYIMNRDGSGKKVIATNQVGEHGYLAWSPNDSLIAFYNSIIYGGNQVIKIVDTSGVSLRQLTSEDYDSKFNNSNNLGWSPDGRKLVYFSNQAGNYDIWMVNVFDSTFTQLTSDTSEDRNPSFRPDGWYVVFQTQRNENWDIYKIPLFLCGDANGDGVINSADVVYLINYLYKAGPAPQPLEAGDANCDNIINSADVVYLINYLFKGGPPPCCP
jgi:Tol biopolymer transport system component